MIEGKKYEVILWSDIKSKSGIGKEGIKTLEKALEDILNEYAEQGYKVAGVWKEAVIMEKK